MTRITNTRIVVSNPIGVARNTKIAIGIPFHVTGSTSITISITFGTAGTKHNGARNARITRWGKWN
jgi:hypothetical protein